MTFIKFKTFKMSITVITLNVKVQITKKRDVNFLATYQNTLTKTKENQISCL